MAIITYVSVKVFELTADDQSLVTTLPKFALIVTISLASYVVICYRLFRLSEAESVVEKIKQMVFPQPSRKNI